MVASIAPLASVTAMRQPLTVRGTRRRRPTANSEMSRAPSVRITSMSACCGEVGGTRMCARTISPAAQPTTR
jgi:hypothetical protein